MPAADPKRAELEQKAREAAARVERSRAMGRQLSLLPAEASPEDPDELEAPRGPGRPPGSRNRSSSKLRAMLAARGYRMPEDLLAELAGLNSRESAIDLAIARAELVLAWAFGDATPAAEVDVSKGQSVAKAPTGGQRLAAFLAVLKEQADAAAALLPYGLEKPAGDAPPGPPPVTIVLPTPQASAAPGRSRQALDAEELEGLELAPPPMPDPAERAEAPVPRDPAPGNGGNGR